MSMDERKDWEDFIRSCRSRPYKSVEQFVPNLHTCEHKEIRNGVEFCHFHNAPTQSSEAVLDDLQLWRMKRMNGTLKKDVWQAWNEETDYINKLRSQQKEREV